MSIFFFYSADRAEPPYIPVVRDAEAAKFWLDPVSLAANRWFARPGLDQIQGLIRDNTALRLKAWYDFFAD